MNEEGQNYWQGEAAASTEISSVPSPTTVTTTPITWEASEYIHHEKNALWFLSLLAFAALLIAISIFLVRSWTFTALIVVMIAAVVVYARRPPRTLSYTLTAQGLQVNEKTYHLEEFRAFGVLQDGPLYSIILIPVKRFLPSVSVYFPQDQGEQIVDMLGDSIPMESVKLDPIDKLVRKLRF